MSALSSEPFSDNLKSAIQKLKSLGLVAFAIAFTVWGLRPRRSLRRSYQRSAFLLPVSGKAGVGRSCASSENSAMSKVRT
jgi:hypothetical protein